MGVEPWVAIVIVRVERLGGSECRLRHDLDVIVPIRIAMKDMNNTDADEITRSLFSYFTVRCSLGEFLFATDHVVAARFYSAG